ncbi:glutathione S-transferase [Roseibium aggregatum]|uniref:Glutathione S-transferase family protein n=1 Tax=Roseibium aggregatum TaxID=187304 RepID=A0A939EIE9_9HYPH|nr:glutathione S-transferase family protein [Roseibium aggregatum]MBN9672997.1 glutathione S-transferase family protein [Roseibium aggregatum]
MSTDRHRLYGRNASPYTRRVAIAMRVLGVPFEQIALSPFSDLEAIREINPLGRVPVLCLPDGETLIESGAILDHLLLTHDTDHSLLPASGAGRRHDLQLGALCQTALDKGVVAGHELLLRPEPKRHAPYFLDRVNQARTAMRELEKSLAPLNSADKEIPSLGEITTAVAFDFLNGFLPQVLENESLPEITALSVRLEQTAPFRDQLPEVRMQLRYEPEMRAE